MGKKLNLVSDVAVVVWKNRIYVDGEIRNTGKSPAVNWQRKADFMSLHFECSLRKYCCIAVEVREKSRCMHNESRLMK